MANYDSNYTGRQVDDSVAFTESFRRTPAEIENTLTRFESIESTPANIDNAVNYLTILEGEVAPSQIRMAYDYFDALEVTPVNVNDAVNKFRLVDSQPSQIDDTVNQIVNNNADNGDILTANGTGGTVFTPLNVSFGEIENTVNQIVNNNADNGDILVADGNGGSEWRTGAIILYHHTAIWTKTDGTTTSRFSFEWIDNQNGSSTISAGALNYLLAYYRAINAPKIALGCIYDNGVAVYINGICYNPTTSKYTLIPDDYPVTNALEFNDFNGWSYNQNTVRIG